MKDFPKVFTLMTAHRARSSSEDLSRCCYFDCNSVAAKSPALSEDLLMLLLWEAPRPSPHRKGLTKAQKA